MPALPVELWTQILRLTMSVPDILTIHLQSPFDESRELSSAEREEQLRAMMAQRLSICFVCKLWYMVAGELVAEFIPVYDPDSLRKGLFKADEDEDTSIFRRCRYWEAGNSWEWSEEDRKLIVKAVNLCRNLVAYRQDDPLLRFPRCVATNCGQSLRRLEVLNIPLPGNFLHLLTTMVPHLEILVLKGCRQDSYDRFTSTTLSLPSLHTLSLVHDELFRRLQFNLPQLKRLNFDCERIGVTPITALSFLRVFPKSIRYLSLKGREYDVTSISAQDLLDIFPGLEELAISLRLLDWSGIHGSYPSLCRIRADSETWNGEPGSPTLAPGLLRALANRDHFPCVDRIRFCSSGSQSVKWTQWWRRWMLNVETMGILIDWNG